MCPETTLYHWCLIRNAFIFSSFPITYNSFTSPSQGYLLAIYLVLRTYRLKVLANINNLSKITFLFFFPMCRSCWGVWIMEEGSPSTGELSIWVRGGEIAGGGHDWPRLTHHHRGNQRRKFNKDWLLPSRWGLTCHLFVLCNYFKQCLDLAVIIIMVNNYYYHLATGCSMFIIIIIIILLQYSTMYFLATNHGAHFSIILIILLVWSVVHVRGMTVLIVACKSYIGISRSTCNNQIRR